MSNLQVNKKGRLKRSPTSYITSMLQLKCNHCREGDLFQNKRSYSKDFMKMNEKCPVCGHLTEIEPGFYYGTGYISYALTIAFSVSTFIAWWVLLGFSIYDKSLFYWLATNAVLLIAMQPFLMRLSRATWFSFFVRYNKHWKEESPKEFERVNKSFKNSL